MYNLLLYRYRPSSKYDFVNALRKKGLFAWGKTLMNLCALTLCLTVVMLKQSKSVDSYFYLDTSQLLSPIIHREQNNYQSISLVVNYTLDSRWRVDHVDR